MAAMLSYRGRQEAIGRRQFSAAAAARGHCATCGRNSTARRDWSSLLFLALCRRRGAEWLVVDKLELAPEVIVVPVKGIALLVGATVVTGGVASLPVLRLEKVFLLSIEVNKEEISVETEPPEVPAKLPP